MVVFPNNKWISPAKGLPRFIYTGVGVGITQLCVPQFLEVLVVVHVRCCVALLLCVSQRLLNRAI